MRPGERPHYVYKLFSEEWTPIYVGVTVDLPKRLAVHSRQPYWSEVVHFSVERFPDKPSGFQAERDAIKMLQPLHNEFYTDKDTKASSRSRLANRAKAHEAGMRCADRQCPPCRSATPPPSMFTERRP